MMKKIFSIALICLTTLCSAQDKGYLNFTSFSTLIGSANDKQSYISSFQMEHNYQINKNIAIGILTGLEGFEVTTTPLAANIKFILPGKVGNSGYLGSTIGYSFPLGEIKLQDIETKDTKGGTLFSVETGYIFPSKAKTKFYTAIGYRHQTLSFKRNDWWLNEIERTLTYNRFYFKIGLRFF